MPSARTPSAASRESCGIVSGVMSAGRRPSIEISSKGVRGAGAGLLAQPDTARASDAAKANRSERDEVIG